MKFIETLSYQSRTEAEVCADFQRIQVLMDNALNDSISVVVEEVGAGLSDPGDQLVSSLATATGSKVTIILYCMLEYYHATDLTNLVEEFQYLVLSWLGSQELR